MLDGVPVLRAAVTLAMVLRTVAGVKSCRIITRAGNARSFPLCSQDIIIMAAAEAYAGFRVGDDRLNSGADMPAYIHHYDAEPSFMICPSCERLPMYVKEVAPHWSMAKIDFTYECSDCGAEIRQTVAKPEH